MNGHHVSVWSVVVLVIGIVTMSFGIVFGFIRETTAKTIDEVKTQVNLQEKRISLLERANDVNMLQLIMMDKKLDQIGSDIKVHINK
jgi:predicted PurR-regulated permease PerM